MFDWHKIKTLLLINTYFLDYIWIADLIQNMKQRTEMENYNAPIRKNDPILMKTHHKTQNIIIRI